MSKDLLRHLWEGNECGVKDDQAEEHCQGCRETEERQMEGTRRSKWYKISICGPRTANEISIIAVVTPPFLEMASQLENWCN